MFFLNVFFLNLGSTKLSNSSLIRHVQILENSGSDWLIPDIRNTTKQDSIEYNLHIEYDKSK